ncbi:MAG: glyoxalase [Promethearchaeota archaeon CR_4]|nr:MAG: glyoxalase [Candidatus Lokiarchaeota archaeon CR_4]
MPKKAAKRVTKKANRTPEKPPAEQPTMRSAPFRVVHFEINTDKPERAIEFYKSVFEWTLNKWEGPMEYWTVMTGDQTLPGIDGGLQRRMAPNVGIVNIIEVPDIDATIAKIKRQGGTILGEKLTVPGVGYVIYFYDTEGNLSGLIQNFPPNQSDA